MGRPFIARIFCDKKIDIKRALVGGAISLGPFIARIFCRQKALCGVTEEYIFYDNIQFKKKDKYNEQKNF